MKMYYIVNARMPTDKAHGIQIAKMCEAFLRAGVDLTLVVSSRGTGDIQKAYGLTCAVPLQRLWVIDLQFLGQIGYWLTALQFMVAAQAYLWWRVLIREQFVLYTVDIDTFSHVPLVWLPRKVFAEMHSAKRATFLSQMFFSRAHIIATNTLIASVLSDTFTIPLEKMLIEPNGVDASFFDNELPQEEARHRLGLSDTPFALYVGRFYKWKGLDILADAAKDSRLPISLVGGTQKEYEHVSGKSGKGLYFYGVRPVAEIPKWLSAADVLIVLGTKENEDSYRYTSPMKIFEYLAARRPVVAARTPANSSIIPENAASWYTPDDAKSLTEAISLATSGADLSKIERGYAYAREHTWDARVERILASIKAIATLAS